MHRRRRLARARRCAGVLERFRAATTADQGPSARAKRRDLGGDQRRAGAGSGRVRRLPRPRRRAAPEALLRVAQALAEDPELDVVYSDSDKLTALGTRADPFFKPDWSPTYALGAMYVGHLLVVRRALVEEVGGLDPAFDTIQDFEFMLRLSERTERIHHIPKILYHWRAIPGSIAAGAEQKSGVEELQARAVTAHLRRIGVAAIAVPHPSDPAPGAARARSRAVASRPQLAKRVSMVVAVDAEARRSGGCSTRSSRSTRTAPAEVIVVTADPRLEAARTRVHVVADPRRGLSRARAANLGAAAATGEWLLFCSDAVEVVEPDWLEQLLVHAALPRRRRGGAADRRARTGAPTRPASRSASTIRWCRCWPALDAGATATTARSSALATSPRSARRSCSFAAAAFDELGGFEESFATGYEDFDLCQRLRARGHGSSTRRGRGWSLHETPAARREALDIVDRALFVDRWYDDLADGDPFFNPNFTAPRGELRPATMTDVTRRPAPMRLVIVYFGPFHVNSAIQAFHFGNDLTDLGWTVTLAGVGDPETIREVGEPRFECVTHHDLPAVAERLRASRRADDRLRLDSARERAARDRGASPAARDPLRRPPRGQRVVPLRGGREVGRARPAPLDGRAGPAHPGALIHPTRSEQFIAGAAGVTMITEELNEFNLARLPHHVARPGIDPERFRPDLGPPLSAREPRDRRRRVRDRLPRHRPLREPARDAEPLSGGEAAAATRARRAPRAPRRDRARRRRPAGVRRPARRRGRARLGRLA